MNEGEEEKTPGHTGGSTGLQLQVVEKEEWPKEPDEETNQEVAHEEEEKKEYVASV